MVLQASRQTGEPLRNRNMNGPAPIQADTPIVLYRKGISWTRILADMEKVLPYNVKIMQIHPTLNSSNQVLLDMTVASEAQPPVIQFLVALEESPLFGSVLDHSWIPPTQTDPVYKHHVSVIYAQKL